MPQIQVLLWTRPAFQARTPLKAVKKSHCTPKFKWNQKDEEPEKCLSLSHNFPFLSCYANKRLRGPSSGPNIYKSLLTGNSNLDSQIEVSMVHNLVCVPRKEGSSANEKFLIAAMKRP
ncbi:hypothetical protein L596_003010 [Steinernema carpocapsae]|uniref:Uncharacterized protein n=1 Tax=Steinernema carpocapsae TaxID=34508 RepID=A0A4U8URC1_STECR|nr:hypothetical protein L596_003010 [Steinernema carpocapsae]